MRQMMRMFGGGSLLPPPQAYTGPSVRNSGVWTTHYVSVPAGAVSLLAEMIAVGGAGYWYESYNPDSGMMTVSNGSGRGGRWARSHPIPVSALGSYVQVRLPWSQDGQTAQQTQVLNATGTVLLSANHSGAYGTHLAATNPGGGNISSLGGQCNGGGAGNSGGPGGNGGYGVNGSPGPGTAPAAAGSAGHGLPYGGGGGSGSSSTNGGPGWVQLTWN